MMIVEKPKRCKVVGFEGAGTDPKTKQYMWSLEAGKGKETFSPKLLERKLSLPTSWLIPKRHVRIMV